MSILFRRSCRDPFWRLAVRLQAEVSHAVALARPLCVARVAVDSLEEIRCRLGRFASESIEEDLIDRIQLPSWESDLVGRYNGAGLLLVLPGTSLSEAALAAERVRRDVDAWGAGRGTSRYGRRITVSLGVAACDPPSDASGRGMIEAAEEALRSAMADGGNRVELFGWRW